MAALIVFLSYLLLRPAITLATELPRALLMLRWQGRYFVTVYLGAWGNGDGWAFRAGRLVIRIHPLFFVLRGSFSDTPSTPTLRQFAGWAASPIAIGFLILSGSVYLVWQDDFDAMIRLAAAVSALLAFVDLGVALLRETEPQTMQCGLVYVGPGATIRCLYTYKNQSLEYLQGLRAYLREDYRLAAGKYETVLDAGIETEDLLEDHAYATCVLGENQKSLASFRKLEQKNIPNSTQQAVAAMALWRSGNAEKALEMVNAAIRQAHGNAIARNVRGWIHNTMHMELGAQFDLYLATQNAPEYATAWANLAESQLANDSVEKATESIEKALQLDPFDLHVLQVQYKVLTWKRDESGARQVWQKIQILEGHFR